MRAAVVMDVASQRIRRALAVGCLTGIAALSGACQQPQGMAARPAAAATGAEQKPLAVDAAAARRGGRLFTGEAPLDASLRGHDQVLPPDALRCSNCHVVDVSAGAGLAAQGASAAAASPAPPRLGAQALLQPQRRRGGPPSSYSAQSFCRLLRSGIDPAQVYTAQTMPNYRISDADCMALWAFLMAPQVP